MKDYEKLSKIHFDNQATDYDAKNTAYYSKYPKISCRDVANRLTNVPYKTLLDVGCGTGFLFEQLQKAKPAEYYGLDLSPEMLKAARSKFGSAVSFTAGSSDELPFSDNFFDVVTCIQSFHHYPYPEKAMSEACRVLKPGGIYILSDTGMGGPVKWFYNKVLLKIMNTGDYAMYGMEDIRRLMENIGFCDCKAYKVSKFVYTVIGSKRK